MIASAALLELTTKKIRTAIKARIILPHCPRRRWRALRMVAAKSREDAANKGTFAVAVPPTLACPLAPRRVCSSTETRPQACA